jgi:hypothetical protein
MDLSTKTLESTVDISNINDIIRKYTNTPEGNCLYQHLKPFVEFEPGNRYDNKLLLRTNLFNIAKEGKNILEVGLNGGHSMAIFFLANPDLKVLSFDICEHKYVKDIATYFGNKYDFNFIEGNSLITLKEYDDNTKYDIIHIDGGHSQECVVNDLINCRRFAHTNTLMIFDDSNASHIESILNHYCKNKYIKEIDYSPKLQKCHFHRIFNYIL